MICFTDIPYSISVAQRKQYGSWGISFDREWLISKGANPVFYYSRAIADLHDDINELRPLLSRLKAETEEDQNIIEKACLASSKLSNYWQALHSGRKDYSEYNEREWRLPSRYIKLGEDTEGNIEQCLNFESEHVINVVAPVDYRGVAYNFLRAKNPDLAEKLVFI